MVFNLRKDLVFNLVFFLEKMLLKFSLLNGSFYKSFFIYTSLLWLRPCAILLRFNSIFYNTILIELFGVDCKSPRKHGSLINYVHIYYNNLFRERFFLCFSGYHNNSVTSISPFFQNAQWPERELAEMFGILFYNKNDTRQLLLDYLFNGYPMLKTYPTSGWSEILFCFPSSWFIFVPIQTIDCTVYDSYYNF